MKIKFFIGNPEFVVYEMLFRILFSVSLFSFFFLLIIRLKTTAFRNWYLEQKLTVLLLLITAFYNNPLYGFKIIKWTTNYAIDAFFKGVLIGFSIFFLLALFDSLRFKNRETNFWFYFPKVFLSGFVGLLTISEGLLRVYINISELNFSESLSSLIELIQQIIAPVFAITFFYILVVIFLALKEVDLIERYKLNLYILTFSICLLSGLIGYQFKKENALIFTIQYAIISLFAILMAYFHWPYEVKKDLIYGEQNQNANDHQRETTFILNEESDN